MRPATNANTMIQRIQTVYLLAIVALMAAMLFPTLATVTSLAPAFSEPQRSVNTAADGTITSITQHPVSETLTFDVWGISQETQMVYPTTYLAVLVILTIAVAFVSIFLYRRRWIQIRLCFALAIMLLGIESYIALYLYKLDSVMQSMGEYATKYSIFDLAPIGALILIYLAFRGISRDEALVRSLDRIR